MPTQLSNLVLSILGNPGGGLPQVQQLAIMTANQVDALSSAFDLLQKQTTDGTVVSEKAVRAALAAATAPVHFNSQRIMDAAGIDSVPAGNLLIGAGSAQVTIGQATGILGFFAGAGSTKPVASNDSTVVAAGAGAPALVDTTYSGGVAGGAYSIGGIVKSLKAVGLLS